MSTDSPTSILIVKTSALGDIVHVFPVVEYLKRRFPKALIDWVVEKPFAELVASHPMVHEVFSINTKKWRKSPFTPSTFSEVNAWKKEVRKKRYDLIFDFQGNLKSSFVLFFTQGNVKVGFGRKSVPEWPNLLFTDHKVNLPKGLNIRNDYLFLVQNYFQDPSPFSPIGTELQLTDSQKKELSILWDSFAQSRATYALICPGAFWKNKQIPLETLKEFLKAIQKKHRFFLGLIYGNQEEEAFVHALQKELFEKSFIIPKLSLPMLQNLMNRMDLVIAMDSLPLHLAGTTSTPTFGFFGPSSGLKYQPLGSQHGVFQGKCPYGKTFEKRCPLLRTCETGACLRQVPSEKLLKAFDSWWSQQR